MNEVAARDQELARIADELDRRARKAIRSDLGFMVAVLAFAVFIAIARPHISWWGLVLTLLACALGAARSLISNLMVRDLRAEVRDLRSGSQFSGLPR